MAAERAMETPAIDDFLGRRSGGIWRQRLLWLAPGTMVIAIAAVVMLAKHPLMPIYLNILGKVIRGH